jgi:hypothetical protein
LSRGVIPAHAVGKDLQRVNRKSIIGIVLALLVVAGFALILWPSKLPPGVGITFESVSEQDTGKVEFRFTNTVTNTMFFNTQDIHQTNGVWWAVPGSRPVALLASEERSFILSYKVPNTTNVWRLGVVYGLQPVDTFTTRTRHKLTALAAQRQWYRLADRVSPAKGRTIYGPEMLGNKPVEKDTAK